MAITLARICANAEKTYGMKLIAGRFSTIFLHPFLHPNGMKVYDFV